jgi:class 3 adenylate cyclase/tetratricopeptide (TPR) repeat protein
MGDREQLELAIAAQEQLRGLVDDEVIDLTIASLREKLAAGGPGSDQRRRQATVLFADVRGFTSLAESADAEVVVDIMNAVWARIDAVIEGAGGRIDKHIGDAVMAVWGAEASSEDDPERAVRAGLELQQALAGDEEASLEMRVGIATGPVVLGEVATTREFTAMGDTVNVAARLEGAAPVGGVLISHDTYRHVRGVFDVRALGPLQVKGRSEPVRAYVVQRAKPQSFRIPSRGVEGVETRMVGRDHELAALQRAFEQVAAGGRAAAVTIVGEAGVGKSRLVYEFENWVELLPERVFYLKARALATRRGVPYGMIRDLLSSRFEIRDSDSPAAVADRLRAGFAPHLSDGESDIVGHWLGFDLAPSPAVEHLRRSEGYANLCSGHLAHYFRSVAETGPALVVLEDLHWADQESLDLIERLLGWVDGSRVLFVGATRPTLLVERAGWLTGNPRHASHVLAPLSEATSRALVDDVLQRLQVVPAEVADLVVARADGNPFFVEELIKMLIDDGVIVTGEVGDPWEIDLGRLDASSIPTTLTGVLEARLDTLTKDDRDALQRASVVGRVFWESAVGALAPSKPSSDTERSLEVARARELIFPSERPSLNVSTEYVFKHALLRDVAYETVLLRDRTRLHGLVADWLEANAGERLGELLELVAEHRLLAGDREAAASGFAAAAERALSAGRSAAAMRLGRRAIALWSEAGAEPPPEAVVRYAEACCRIGAYDDAAAATAGVLQRELSPVLESDALYYGSWVAGERGDPTLERALLERALPLAEAVGGTALVHVLFGLAWWGVGEGELDFARQHASRALDLADRSGDVNESVRALTVLAVIASLDHDLELSQSEATRAVELAAAVGNLEAEMVARGNLGVAHHLRGDETGDLEQYELAAEQYRMQLERQERIGVASSALNAGLNLAQVYLRLGRLDEAEAALHEARRIDLLAQSVTLRLFATIVEADLRLLRGDTELGLELLADIQHDPALREQYRHDIGAVVARVGLTLADVEAAGQGRTVAPDT